MLNRRKNALKSKYPFLGNDDRLSVDVSLPRQCPMSSADQSPQSGKGKKSVMNPLQIELRGCFNQNLQKRGKVGRTQDFYLDYSTSETPLTIVNKLAMNNDDYNSQGTSSQRRTMRE